MGHSLMGGWDAIVIGGGVSGYTAASYLAKAGKQVVLLEAGDTAGSFDTWPLHALDPTMVSELKLARRGMAFAWRDMPLIGLRSDGRHIAITRDLRATSRSLAVHSQIDSENWGACRRDLWALARAMRSLWWNGRPIPYRCRERIERIRRTGAGAWLDRHFESDGLKAVLMQDAAGASPLAAGSALLFAWRAAQEMCGLQSAVAMPVGDTLAKALVSALPLARVAIRLHTHVAELLIENGSVKGVRLDSGETISAPIVLSALSRRETLLRMARGEGLGETERALIGRRAPGAARVILALDAKPAFKDLPVNGRFVIAGQWESLAMAHAAARSGCMPDELAFEFILPHDRHVIDVLVRPVPHSFASPDWKALLAAKVIAALQRVMPGLLHHVTGIDIVSPEAMDTRFGSEDEPFDGRRLLAEWKDRITTPFAGLFLCGAEPVHAISGRAARIAARLALSVRY